MEGGEIFVPKLPSIRIADLAEAVCPGAKHQNVGIRPGEKLHETLVSADEGVSTYELPDRFITYPAIVAVKAKMEHGKPLGLDFVGYRSDLNTKWLTVENLRRMVEEESH